MLSPFVVWSNVAHGLRAIVVVIEQGAYRGKIPMSSYTQYALMHIPASTNIGISFGAADVQITPKHIAAAARLIRAYRTTASQSKGVFETAGVDLWTSITNKSLHQVQEFILNDDAEQLAAYLTQLGNQTTWFGGITTGVDGYSIWYRQDHAAIAFQYFDNLLCLAEALGVLPFEAPEQRESGNWGKNVQLDPNLVAEALSDHLRIDIIPPQGIIPVVGLKLEDGILHYRHINALYMAARIRDLTRPLDRICEYGGGLGLVAFYLHRMGWRDVTLFDLPVINILSGFFLIGALGDEAVCLEGETLRRGAIKIRAYWNCVDTPRRYFRLSANQDSFPEISVDIVKHYLQQIERHTSEYFLHINQEVQHSITDTVRHLNVPGLIAAQTKMQRIYRGPYWVRRGYAEELYRMQPGLLRKVFRM